MNIKLSLPKETIHRLTGSSLKDGVARNQGLPGGAHPRAGFHAFDTFSSLTSTLTITIP